MRFTNIALKIVVAILLFVLFSLFLIYATGFGEDGNLIDLAMSNVLIMAMVLVLILSAFISLIYDFYEQKEHQNEEVFNSLNEKIEKLEELAPQLKQSMAENAEKISALAVVMNEKIDENSTKVAEYMTQFANLSVQVFAKGNSAKNMTHEEKEDLFVPQKKSEDYFNHYKFNSEDVEIKAESVGLSENTKLESLDLQQSEVMLEESEDKLSAIFNDDLAQTLSELEIMKDEEAAKDLQDIDLTSYFNEDKKITL